MIATRERVVFPKCWTYTPGTCHNLGSNLKKNPPLSAPVAFAALSCRTSDEFLPDHHPSLSPHVQILVCEQLPPCHSRPQKKNISIALQQKMDGTAHGCQRLLPQLASASNKFTQIRGYHMLPHVTTRCQLGLNRSPFGASCMAIAWVSLSIGPHITQVLLLAAPRGNSVIRGPWRFPIHHQLLRFFVFDLEVLSWCNMASPRQ